MTAIALAVVGVVFVAALLQAATGMGFGIIAGPILLIAMGDTAAIQVTIVLSTIPSLILVRRSLDAADPVLLKHFLGGAAAGLAAGALLFATATVADLTWGAAAAVLAMAVLSTGVHERRVKVRGNSITGRLLTGLTSGAMTATLAMPGPPVAAWASATGLKKARTRATLLIVALVCYPAALALQSLVDGISDRVVDECLWLALPVVAGTFLGQAIAGRVPERLFRRLVTVLLVLVALALVIR
ncbi:MAG: TSUP family transporter [bacterium]|nr:TSUP family transporter [bacterium]